MRQFKKEDVTVNKTLDSGAVRDLCVRKRYYTKGNVKQYTDMLSYCKEDTVNENGLLAIAYDIAAHSDNSLWEGATFREFIQNIMYELDKHCIYRTYSINADTGL